MDLLTVFVAAAVAVWAGWFLLRGSIPGCALAAVIVGSCFGYVFWHAEGVPISIDRAMIGFLALAYVFHRWWGLTDPKPLGRPEWVMLALLTVLTASTFTHDWKIDNSQPATHLVLYWIFPALVYWVARQSPLDDRTLRRLWTALAVFGVYLVFIAFAEAGGGWSLVFPSYIASPTTEYFGRARGPFLNPAEMGIFLSACLSAALVFWPRHHRAGQLLLSIFACLSLAGIYFTLTRSAWMGGALGLAVFVGLSVPRQWRGWMICGGAIVGLVLLAVSWDSIWTIKRDANLDASASADSAELRPILAKVAWEMFQDRPLLGWGYGQYDHEKMPYLADRSSDLPLEKTVPYTQHNAFLALLVENGIIGMGLFIVLLALWVRDAWRVFNRGDSSIVRRTGILFLALLGAYLPNSMFQNTSIIDGVNLLLFFVAGIVSGLAAKQFRPIRCLVDVQQQRLSQPNPELVLQS
jgi:O-antigen ligase